MAAAAYRLLGRRDRRQLAANVDLIYGLPAGSHFAKMFAKQVYWQQAIIALETLKLMLRPERIWVVGSFAPILPRKLLDGRYMS